MLKSVRCSGLRSLIRNVHWLNALTAATIIVSFGPSSSSDAKSTAYDTDMVEDRRASGRLTLKTDVTDDISNSSAKTHLLPVNGTGKNSTSRMKPIAMTAHTYTRAATGRPFTRLPRRPCGGWSSQRVLRETKRRRAGSAGQTMSGSAAGLLALHTTSAPAQSAPPQAV